MAPRIVAIIQARMGSTRLPGKVLMDISGGLMLARVHDRVEQSWLLDEVAVATTTLPIDNPIADYCAHHLWPCYRGSEEDVLDRYYQAALRYKADFVVRITADCPFISPMVMDRVINEFWNRQPDVDYAWNGLPWLHRYPRGLDVEVMTMEVLKEAWESATDVAEREHVTPYIRHHPERFDIYDAVCWEGDYSHMRWTVDTSKDLEFARAVYDHLEWDCSWKEVLALLEQYPHLQEINQSVAQKKLP